MNVHVPEIMIEVYCILSKFCIYVYKKKKHLFRSYRTLFSTKAGKQSMQLSYNEVLQKLLVHTFAAVHTTRLPSAVEVYTKIKPVWPVRT